MKKTKIDHYTDKEALDFHKNKRPGKIEIISSKNITTKRDFFQAEDGIRDWSVTGVQTCALPI